MVAGAQNNQDRQNSNNEPGSQNQQNNNGKFDENSSEVRKYGIYEIFLMDKGYMRSLSI